jgi:predicted CXXCH cytochrome family protein
VSSLDPAHIALIAVVLLLHPNVTLAVEHPGVLTKSASCSGCHADKLRGRSVHSAMSMACTTCHLVQTESDMTVTNLVMPREELCFACHQKGVQFGSHKAVAEACVQCHDSHSSKRPMLLRGKADGPLRTSSSE